MRGVVFLAVLFAAFPTVNVRAQSPLTVLVPRGATWKYLDDGTDQGTAWSQPTFDDSSWSRGGAQLGYGDWDEITRVKWGPSYENKYVTTYFRHAFTVTNPGAFAGLFVRMIRDDGAVAYLNGTEVFRSNMPVGPISHQTLAASIVDYSAENRFFEMAVDPKLLVTGTNVLAVEIHQESVTSPDISFDLELHATDGGPRVIRGPYLQMATPSSIIVRWRTDLATDTAIWFGPAPTQLQQLVTSTTLATEHTVKLSNLTADTRYYYGVGTSLAMRAGGDNGHSFVTHPAAARPVHICIQGDGGSANLDAATVMKAYRTFTGGKIPDLWLLLGDNAYEKGSEVEYQSALFEMFPEMLRQVGPWSAFGNHESGNSSSKTQTGPYYDAFDFPTQGEVGGLASGTEAYYSFDHGDIHFVFLDSEDSDRTPTGPMLTWAAADLAKSRAKWNIVLFHHPPHTRGSHDSDNRTDSGGRMWDMREDALPILEQGGADLVIAGHSHNYERSYLIDGFYKVTSLFTPNVVLDWGDGDEASDGAYYKPSAGRAPHEGTVYIVAGCAGRARNGKFDHPAMVRGLWTLGTLMLDIDGNKLVSRFIDEQGQQLDTFTLYKGVKRTLTRDVARISHAAGGTQQLFLDAGKVHAGGFYLVAGSFDTTPGFVLGTLQVPLNIDDWFHTTTQLYNTPTFTNTAGSLDASGQATASINLPVLNDPKVVGTRLHHAYLVYDASGPRLVSNPVSLTFDP